jgi:acid phosphatase
MDFTFQRSFTSRHPWGSTAGLLILLLAAAGCGGDAARGAGPDSTPIASVTVTPNPAAVAVAATVQLTATLRDANGNPIAGAVSWSSSNTAIATVGASGVATGIAVGTVTITATSGGRSGAATLTVTAGPPQGSFEFGHIFIVMEENSDYGSVIGNPEMPYLNGLASRFGLATQYYADTHPSIGNYFMLITGQIITNDDSYTGTVTADNIVRRLIAAGKTWKAYAEDLPSVGYLTIADNGSYTSRHNPVVYLSDVRNDASQARNVVPFTQLATDLANGTLPDWAMIVPNRCHDAHDCSLGTADTWLASRIAPLLANPVFQQDGLLIIVFDEAGGDNTHGGGRIAWVAVSGKAKSGYRSSALYQHQSTLRLMLEGLGITSFPGAAAGAPDMTEFFVP